ncbi:MAG TPA: GDP-mannose 4,6-dehydratase [Acidobacteriota bacterium]|nr:GDP-mannose 4,6-dehydratase [Acidobacteriota bacterium]
MKTAFITGITGQDGSYLAELLLAKGYTVHAMIRRASTFNTRRIDHIYQDPHDPDARLFLHYSDLASTEWLADIMYQIRPNEMYHLAAQSHVRVSFDLPEYTADITGTSTVRILEAVRRSGVKTRFYQASSSEMFGNAPAPQSERTPFYPQSPYAAAKVYSYWMTRMYREAYGLFACNGIFFNHESPRRGETFVTRKITRGLALILAGRQKKLYLGNLKAQRDWGYAPEYVEAMWKILQQETPEDFVIGTGETHSVEEFVAEAFAYVGRDWREYVEIDPRYYRPLEVDTLQADTQKARTQLDWTPSVGFKDLVKIMVDADLEANGIESPGEGKRILAEKFTTWHHWDSAVTKLVQSTEGKASQ